MSGSVQSVRRRKMKIIKIDNFDRGNISDEVVAENVNLYYGPKIVRFLNDNFSGETVDIYFRLVKDDHILFKFEP